MIDTVRGMMDETGLAENYIYACLMRWARQGRAVKTDRVVVRDSPGPGRRKMHLWKVQDRVWQRFLTRGEQRCLDLARLSSKEYLREAKCRWRSRVSHLKYVAYPRLRAESFARRNPFVVLDDA